MVVLEVGKTVLLLSHGVDAILLCVVHIDCIYICTVMGHLCCNCLSHLSSNKKKVI